MLFSFSGILKLLDATVLNPAVSAAVLASAIYAESIPLPADSSQLLQACSDILQHNSTLVKGASRALLLGLLLRVNRYFSQKALNNGASARFDWDKEIIVVTGGSYGIGAATVQRLAGRGSTVIVLDVKEPSYPTSDNIHFYRCNLSKLGEVEKVANEIRKHFGDPTCVVANAGVYRRKSIFEASEQDITSTFGVNNLGILWPAKTFLPSMAQRNHGHFLVVASVMGHISLTGAVDYASSKAASIGIYEGIRSEMRHLYNAPAVRVSCVSPYTVNTEMFEGNSTPDNFFLPRLTPQGLAETITDVLWSGRAQNRMLPSLSNIMPLTRLLPEWVSVVSQDVLKDSMSGVRARPGQAQ